MGAFRRLIFRPTTSDQPLRAASYQVDLLTHQRGRSITKMSCPMKQSDPCYYSSYLGLPSLLDAQKPNTDAHDEMLFITTHQTFEIWFKQVLLEMRTLGAVLSEPEPKLQTACELLQRICRILNHLVNQFTILETMTPLDFLRFRYNLGSASGFQSVQFRLLEIGMGLSDKQRVYPLAESLNVFQKEERSEIELALKQPTLVEKVDLWLSRFDIDEFWAKYSNVIGNIQHFGTIINDAEYRMQDHQLSFKSFRTGIMIHLLREKFGQEYTILSRLCEFDELMSKWRFHHAAMVQRMIGRKTGTGGSSGSDYLHETARRHSVFTDLLLIPQYLVVIDGI